MKQLIILAILALLLPSAAAAQTTVMFDYDAAGNRIKRWISVKELKSSDSLFTDPALYQVLAGLPADEPSIAGYRATQVYPNPVERILTVAPGSEATAVCRYRLLDTQGRLLEDETTDSYPFRINMQQLQAGTYYLHLQSGELNQLFKLIKR
jgi:hypothetical protein